MKKIIVSIFTIGFFFALMGQESSAPGYLGKTWQVGVSGGVNSVWGYPKRNVNTANFISVNGNYKLTVEKTISKYTSVQGYIEKSWLSVSYKENDTVIIQDDFNYYVDYVVDTNYSNLNNTQFGVLYKYTPMGYISPMGPYLILGVALNNSTIKSKSNFFTELIGENSRTFRYMGLKYGFGQQKIIADKFLLGINVIGEVPFSPRIFSSFFWVPRAYDTQLDIHKLYSEMAHRTNMSKLFNVNLTFTYLIK